MYFDKLLEKIKLDNIIVWVPVMFAYVIFMVETDNKARFVIVLALFIILTSYVLATNHQYSFDDRRSKRRDKTNLILVFAIFAVPVCLSWYILFYFLVGIITIPLIIYKIFEFLGDVTESVVHVKAKVSLIFASYVKFIIWLLGYIVFIVVFLGFIIRFATLYPNHSVTLILLELQSDTVTVIAVITISLIIAVFIIDFLIKMVFINLKPVSFKTMRRFEIQQLFFKIAIVIIFADLAYSLMYLTSSGMKANKVASLNGYMLLLFDYLRAFYYAFSLHFAIPMPTTPFFNELDALVRGTSTMQIVRFFHFCINKIVDITILAYMAGIVLNALGFKQEKS